jgi:hypothetical protein
VGGINRGVRSEAQGPRIDQLLLSYALHLKKGLTREANDGNLKEALFRMLGLSCSLLPRNPPVLLFIAMPVNGVCVRYCCPSV